MKFTMFVPALAAMSIALTIPTLAEAGCDGLKGKDKKACIKKEKANAGSTPYTPSQLGAAFTAWDEEGKNPFAMEAYSVRSNESGFADVDAYLGKIWRIQAVVAGARYTVDQVAAGDAEAVKLVPEIMPMVKELPDLVTALKDEAPALVEKLPEILTGADAMKIPKISGSIMGAATGAVSAVADLPKLLEALKNLAADPSAAAGAAAAVGTEAAGEAAGDVAGDAVEAAGDAAEAAGDAVEAAGDAVEAATGGE
jgi:hypothetical protein